MPLSTLFGTSVLLLAMAVPPAAASPIDNLQWKKRVVIVFGLDEAQVDRQLNGMLADREALAERELVLIHVDGEAVAVPFGDVDPPRAGALREAFRVSPDIPFTVILVGKDGGEKLRQTEPVSPEDIFSLIDSMPMRQSETRD
ncbi:MAG: DUF4174 domain-containing protein [Methylobacterium mesophilicum]|nr:DUF4174 domain-containing protein [Methylobacterium mesophilicum]